MREMWMMATVLFPVVSGGALWIWKPGKNKIHTAAAVLSLAEAVCSWLVILNHLETGADGEYIGADGHYGLGRVMALDETEPGSRLTVLQW